MSTRAMPMHGAVWEVLCDLTGLHSQAPEGSTARYARSDFFMIVSDHLPYDLHLHRDTRKIEETFAHVKAAMAMVSEKSPMDYPLVGSSEYSYEDFDPDPREIVEVDGLRYDIGAIRPWLSVLQVAYGMPRRVVTDLDAPQLKGVLVCEGKYGHIVMARCLAPGEQIPEGEKIATKDGR